MVEAGALEDSAALEDAVIGLLSVVCLVKLESAADELAGGAELDADGSTPVLGEDPELVEPP